SISDDYKSLILGDMLELGKESEAEHKAVLEYIRESGYTNAYFVGKNFGMFANEYPYMFFDSVDDLNKYFVTNPEKSKMFLVKGSRGMRLEKVVDYL
ncbi:MAG: UDP-N-acetylmuramoyl-tripeptide--D-alanyl-D-alanine ligase, partial [Bacteroidales bacterium]|nr:UDP-N-acetylmuramoyl-tripeptide--D-alanyl-D-alanine ligase [Bacteroidales bacterium]